MKIFKDTVEIAAPPEKVWEWLFHFADHYCEWHPDHRKAYWSKGTPNEIGSVLYTEEKLSGHVLKFSIRIHALTPNRLIEFHTVGGLKLFLPRGSFEIEPASSGCKVTATLVFRVGPILSRLAKKILNGVVQHMKEEGENLKKILENGS